MTLPTHASTVSGTWNFRDIGGTPTPGGPVRYGVVYRSAMLAALDPGGLAALRDLGVTDVFDLRGELEIARDGVDAVPDAVTHRIAPFHPEDGQMPVHEAAEEASTPSGQMERVRHYYSLIPIMTPAKRSVATLLRTIADGEGGVLVHCAAGKDRTGWAIATVLTAAGADREAVMADYLLSNASIASLREWIRGRYGNEEDVSDEVLGVDESFLAAGWASMEREYGSFEGYLAAIGVTEDEVRRLRVRLTG